MLYTYTTYSTYTSTSSVTYTPTSYTYITTTYTQSYTKTVPTIVPFYTQGYQSMSIQNMKRDIADHVEDEIMVARPASIARRYVAAPTMVSGWSPKKISAACAQIATGTVTQSSYVATSTSTVATSSAVQTVTQLVGAAAAVTSTYTQKSASYTTTYVTSGTSTKTIATGCPLATQISCFTLQGQSAQAPHVNNHSLAVMDNYGNPNFAYTQYPYWYLTCNGSLVNVATFNTFGYYGNTYSNVGSISRTQPATCTPAGEYLDCKWNGQGLSIEAFQSEIGPNGQSPSSFSAGGPFDTQGMDSRTYCPVWGNDTSQDRSLVPLALLMTPVTCPCAY